ncbi:MAG: hypothetical protein AB1758_37110, partial [Candidatus Eremiobacterota bacterium]
MTRKRLSIALVALLLGAGMSLQARSQPEVPLSTGMVGVWLSPDWLFPGTRQYSETEVRRVARQTMAHLSRQGVTTVFLETFLRGYSICPAVERSQYTARVLPYQPGRSGLPVYPHLEWNYRVEGGKVMDTLQIFIDEGRNQGIEVHAWCHMFYWKMDNTEAMLPWHSGPSLWNELMVEYLRREAARLDGKATAAPDTVALMREAAGLYETSSEGRELSKILARHHLADLGSPMGTLLRQVLRAGGDPPDFVLISRAEDPFPAPRNKMLRPIFVNPEHPGVQKRLLDGLSNIVEGHPGLGGLHLDHVRYPVDGQGLPEWLDIRDGAYNYYDAANPTLLSHYRHCHEILRRREETLRVLVQRLRDVVGRHRSLSAAVLPLYYRDRDNGRFRLSGYDFACQDWYTWKVDFVVPMMYEFHPWVIRTLMRRFVADLESRYGSQTIMVYPGISRWQAGSSGQ